MLHDHIGYEPLVIDSGTCMCIDYSGHHVRHAGMQLHVCSNLVLLGLGLLCLIYSS